MFQYTLYLFFILTYISSGRGLYHLCQRLLCLLFLYVISTKDPPSWGVLYCTYLSLFTAHI